MHLKTILSNKTTRRAILYTLGIFIIFKLGNYIISPGINGDYISNLSDSTSGLLQTLSLYGGGNITQLTLFALGLGPYITASVVVQLLETDLVPKMSEWKHQGEEGSKKRTRMTKYLSLLIAFAQAATFITAFSLTPAIDPVIIGSNMNLILAITAMTSGTFILVWLGDRITEHGVGNGISTLIMAGIVSSLPGTFYQIYEAYFNQAVLELTKQEYILNIALWGFILVIQLILILVVIYFNLARRKIRINYVKSSRGKNNKNSYLPLKINPAGVIPVIFVQPVMLVPMFLLNTIPYFSGNGIGKYEIIVRAFFDTSTSNTYWYVAVLFYTLLVIGFSVLYSYIQMNPNEMSQNLEKQNAYIVGVRSGEDTEAYLSQIIGKTSIWGGVMLGFIAAVPLVIYNLSNITINLGLLGTGLIISVSVITQFYEGLLTKTEKNTYRRIFGESK